MRTTWFALALIAAAAACGSPTRAGGGGGTGGGGGDDDGNGDGSNPGSTAIPTSCADAEANHSSVGCEYYAVDMDAAQGPPQDACFAVFIANTSTSAVHIQSQWNGQAIDLSQFAKLPTGNGTSLTYGAYDPVAGLAPGKVAILFLAYFQRFSEPPQPACPVAAAIGDDAQMNGTGIGHAFHIATDQPVVAYQMLPYGGGDAAATGASLLLPTSSWGQEYIAVSAYDPLPQDLPPISINIGGPSHNYVAATEGTTVTITPTMAIAAGGTTVPAGSANEPYSITLHRGEYLQITQSDPLSGSTVTADHPIGAFGGHQIMSIDRCCGDHGEQMLSPVQALGAEYVGAPHGMRDNAPETHVYRVFGAVDGTQLTYEPAGLGPATIDKGKFFELRTDAPFVVRSQDSDHPFSAFTYMTGGGDPNGDGSAYGTATGDPDFVRLVPPLQFLSHYVFFTDPTYPFTQLTVVRQKGSSGSFSDVKLACMSGPITDWAPVGTSGQYQISFVKIDDAWIGQNGCNTGVQGMDSDTPFGVWVWGWGDVATGTESVSYGYPAGENVQPINTVVLQ
jgi:hypothetical protein